MLTKRGEQLLRSFKRRYGNTEGKSVFYAWLNTKSPLERQRFEIQTF